MSRSRKKRTQPPRERDDTRMTRAVAPGGGMLAARRMVACRIAGEGPSSKGRRCDPSCRGEERRSLPW
eukprot:16429845-Heterocapsa_arctica.AAC.2